MRHAPLPGEAAFYAPVTPSGNIESKNGYSNKQAGSGSNLRCTPCGRSILVLVAFPGNQRDESAAKANDAGTFNTHVDYPRLRESLKGQFSSLMAEQMGKSTDSSNPFAAFGTMLGLAMVDKLVDAMVRPETVMRGMQNGQFGPKASPPDADTGTPASPTNQNEKPRWSYVRKGTDKLIAYPEGGAEQEDKKVAIVLELSGFANWKITELRLQSLKP